MEQDPRAIREALDRLLESKTFRRSSHLRRFLELTISRSLEGRGEEIKEATIGVEVYDRPKSYDPGHDSIVRTEASRLRKKLGSYYEEEGKDDPIRIEYPRGSYLPEFRDTRQDAPPVRIESEKPKLRRSRLRMALCGALVLTVLAVGTAALLRRAAFSAAPTVAVLPFEDLTPGATNAALAVATSDAVSSELSRVHGIMVISPRAALSAHEPVEVPEGSAPLASTESDYVVEGSFQRSGDRCRVTARLVRRKDDALVWSTQYSFDWVEVFETQEQIGLNVASEIGARIGSEPTPARPDRNVSADAYEALDRARYAESQLQNTGFPEYATQAEGELTRALAIHPDYVDALSELATLKFDEALTPGAEADRLLAESRDLLEHTLRIEPDHVRSLSLLGKLEAHRGSDKDALALASRAVALDPNDASVRSDLAAIYAWMGFYESALVECDRAISLQTLSAVPYRIKIRLLTRLGRLDEADEALERLRRSSHPGPMFTALEAARAVDARPPNRVSSQLRATMGRYQSIADTSLGEVVYGLARAQLGDEGEARRVLEKYRDQPLFWDDLVNLALVLDENALAVAQIERTPMARNYRWLLSNPYLKSRMRETSFQKLAESLYRAWRTNLDFARETLPAAPPDLPAPRELEAAASPPARS